MRQVMDNRYLIANLIQCQPDTPRYIPTGDVDIFAVQEAVIQDILQSAQEQQTVEAAPRKIDPVQQTLITLLRSAAGRAELALGGPSRPAWDRRHLLDLVKLLGRPLPNVHVRALHRAYERHQASAEVEALVARRRGRARRGGRGARRAPPHDRAPRSRQPASHLL